MGIATYGSSGADTDAGVGASNFCPHICVYDPLSALFLYKYSQYGIELPLLVDLLLAIGKNYSTVPPPVRRILQLVSQHNPHDVQRVCVFVHWRCMHSLVRNSCPCCGAERKSPGMRT